MSIQVKKRLCLTLLVCNLVFIWGNSLLPREASAAFSQAVAAWIRQIFQLEANIMEGTGHGTLRKIAHFAEFLSLGALLHWQCCLQWKKLILKWILPFGLGVAAACVDETIQIFNAGRGAALRDVCIDSSGVLAGILFGGLLCLLLRKNSQKKHRK